MGRTRIAVTIAGSDSSGGAGIQADLKTFSACGVYGASIITALTAQNTRGVTSVLATPPQMVLDQIDAVFDDLEVDAVKIGMVGSAEVARVMLGHVNSLTHRGVPVVLDPVMVATTGARLIEDDAANSFGQLIGAVSLVTPNLFEASQLLGVPEAASVDEMVDQANQLLRMGAQRVLLKGGHLDGDAVDILATPDGIEEFVARRVPTKNTHGTGCSLSSAVAAHRAHGASWSDAVGASKEWLTGALKDADELGVGHGAGPVHHFHELWPHLKQR